MVELKDICDDILSGGTPSTKNQAYWNGDIPWITSADILNVKTAKPRKYITEKAIRESATNLIKKGNVIVVTRVGLGKLFKNDFDVCISQDSQGLILKNVANADYLVYVLKDRVENFKKVSQGSTIQGVTKRQLSEIQIPLPPLEVQQEIVSEIDGYQQVIDGARAVVENYRPHIAIDPDWPRIPIGDIVDNVLTGLVRNKAEQDPTFSYPYIKMNNITSNGTLDLSDMAYINATPEELNRYTLRNGDFIYNTRNSPELVGKSTVFHGKDGSYLFNNNILRIRFGPRALSDFVNLVMNSEYGKDKIRTYVDGTTSVAALYQKNYLSIEIPLPPLETQQAIVSEIKAEQALVDANRELVERFEKKIQDAVGRVWGQGNSVLTMTKVGDG